MADIRVPGFTRLAEAAREQARSKVNELRPINKKTSNWEYWESASPSRVHQVAIFLPESWFANQRGLFANLCEVMARAPYFEQHGARGSGVSWVGTGLVLGVAVCFHNVKAILIVRFPSVSEYKRHLLSISYSRKKALAKIGPENSSQRKTVSLPAPVVRNMLRW